MVKVEITSTMYSLLPVSGGKIIHSFYEINHVQNLVLTKKVMFFIDNTYIHTHN
jgi:hypothetical protein